MPVAVQHRYLDPKILSEIGKLDLVAKTVVEGFVAGLHRSPDFGLSQEFAEYRAYTPGDDLRHVDWNVYARTDRAYLKRFRGETNTELTILLDASASMGFGSERPKIEFAKFLAASLAYLAHLQRDATGLIVFNDEITGFAAPSSRQGQLARLLHLIDGAAIASRTDFQKPFLQVQQLTRRRGITVLISDLFEDPETILSTVIPLRSRGQELILFHVLDAAELEPKFTKNLRLEDLETGDSLEVTPEYARTEYQPKIRAHIAALQKKAEGAGIDYRLLNTSQPLDKALRDYLQIRQRRH